MGNSMNIYVVRHGKTDWNTVKRLQGRSDTDLNQEGIEAAIRTGEALKDIPFDIAFTSPLKRAKETAELILQSRQVPVIEDERIIEISFGEYEGLISDPKHYEIPDKEFRNFFEHPENYHTPPGGESLTELGERTKDFMEDIMSRKELSGKTILVASHGCATRGILNSIRTFPIEDFWHGGVPKNCSVALIEVKDGIPRLVFEDKVFERETGL